MPKFDAVGRLLYRKKFAQTAPNNIVSSPKVKVDVSKFSSGAMEVVII